MTQFQMFQKVESGGGPIFKVVLECLKRSSEPFLIYIYCIQCDFMPKSCWKHSNFENLNRNLLNFLNKYGIFWVPPGESSCPDGSEYVWQRGVGSRQGRVTAGRSWPLFREKKNRLRRCSKNLAGRNFAIHILNRLDMRIHQVAPKIYHTYSKIWVNRDWVIRFFCDFWGWEPDLHSEFSNFQNLSVFSNFLHEITLYAIDIDKKRFRTPFLAL